MLMGNDDVSRSLHFPEEFTLTKKKKKKYTQSRTAAAQAVCPSLHITQHLSLSISIDLLNAGWNWKLGFQTIQQSSVSQKWNGKKYIFLCQEDGLPLVSVCTSSLNFPGHVVDISAKFLLAKQQENLASVAIEARDPCSIKAFFCYACKRLTLCCELVLCLCFMCWALRETVQ